MPLPRYKFREFRLKGSDSLGVYVGNEKVHYDEIRNVELVDHVKWNQ